MTLPFALLAGLVLGGSLATVLCRNRVHSGLFLAVSLVGLAMVFLRLGAEFIGFVQVLVYVGAVAVLIVFAILLTRGVESPRERIANAPGWGILLAATLFALLAWAVSGIPGTAPGPGQEPRTMSVRDLGDRLLRDDVLPLQTLGLLLTAALIGASLIALPPARNSRESSNSAPRPPNPA